MTTSDEIIVNTNEGESNVQEPKQRNISELLVILERDKTFQGMTDAEIFSILEYEKNLAAINAQTMQSQINATNYQNAMQQLTNNALQQQNNMLQSIIERASNLQLKVVQYG